jgi:hypothetical protein
VLAEIGRIREQEYRRVGAGRNVARDIDAYDTGAVPYRQLVAWDPLHREILSLYSVIFCRDALAHGRVDWLRTTQLFSYSSEFSTTVLPAAVELGRSVVNSGARRAILGLFAVWGGLGAIMVERPDIAWFFGNVSVYRTWPAPAIAHLLAYLAAHHAPTRPWLHAHPDYAYHAPEVATLCPAYRTAADPWEALTAALARFGCTPPPILLSYLRSSDGLVAHDTAVDHDFGGALEIAITVPVSSVTRRTRDRFVSTYRAVNGGLLR